MSMSTFDTKRDCSATIRFGTSELPSFSNPSWPCREQPHAYSSPRSFSATEWCAPHAIVEIFLTSIVLMRVGTDTAWRSAPSPSCPSLPIPDESTLPSFISTRRCAEPQACASIRPTAAGNLRESGRGLYRRVGVDGGGTACMA